MKQNSTNHLNFRVIVGVVLVLAASGVGLVFQTTEASHDPAEHVREVLNQNAAAIERSDMTMLTKIWANDVTVFEQGRANYGWQDYRDNHLAHHLAPETKNTKYALSDIKVKMAGTTAWATFKYAISADVGARHVDVGG